MLNAPQNTELKIALDLPSPNKMGLQPWMWASEYVAVGWVQKTQEASLHILERRHAAPAQAL